MPTIITQSGILEAKRRQHAQLSAEIAELETELRSSSTLKVGDYVKIMQSASADGQYGQLVRVGNPYEVVPYLVRTIPYNISVHAAEVVAVDNDEIRTFLYAAAITVGASTQLV